VKRSCLQLIHQLNVDKKIHGILVQAPLPKHIRQEIVYSAVAAGEGRGWFSSGQCRQADVATRVLRVLHSSGCAEL